MATGDDAKIMLSDHGSNERLLAHELGCAIGFLHPDALPRLPPLMCDQILSIKTISDIRLL